MHKSCVINAENVREMIRSALHSANDAHLLHRLDGVLLVAEGRSCGEVAGWFGVDRRTVERWVRAAGARGVDGLVDHHHGGRPAKVSSAQMQGVRLALLAPPSVYGYPDRQWTGKRLALHLARQLGLEMSVRNCQRMIAGGGYRANAAASVLAFNRNELR